MKTPSAAALLAVSGVVSVVLGCGWLWGIGVALIALGGMLLVSSVLLYDPASGLAMSASGSILGRRER